MATKTAKPAKGKKADKPAPKQKASSAPAKAEEPKRALGLRGAAPWAARHAAKHAAEARKRAEAPALPGSARATIRTPEGADLLKQQIGELFTAMEKVRGLRKNVAKNFYELGVVLRDIKQRNLFTAKGYQAFEAFAERELDLGKSLALRLTKVVSLFQPEAAAEMGMDKALEALAAVEGDTGRPSSEARLLTAKPLPSASSTRGPIVGR